MFRNDGADGYGGGGWDVSGFGGTSQTPQTDKKGEKKRADRIVPVTVRQVLESNGPKTGSDIDIEGKTVKLVGIVKKITRSHIKVTFSFEDYTGTIDGVHWLESENDDNFVISVVENTYCTMVGSIRNVSNQHSERHIMVFSIFPVEDLNLVTAHTLQIMHMSLKSELISQKTNAPSESSFAPQGGMNNFNESNELLSSLTPVQQRVLKAVMLNSNDLEEKGKHVDEIMASLTVKMSMKELENVLDFLSTEGHIYSTCDDKHFKATG